MDFFHDQPATGAKLRILTVADTISRFSPAVVPQFSFSAPDVIEVLERVCGESAIPLRSGSSGTASSSLAIWTRGPTRAA